MAERTDLDALLISALYGELAPADEARLAAHLESHPADRSALADLTQTREAVRASRVFAVQLEPPQSVSARLLQEAARSAPRPARRGDDAVGWFHRFTRVFIAHPALATATTFVLVVGVAGLLYVQRGEQIGVPAPPAAGSDGSRVNLDEAKQQPAAEPQADSRAAPRGQTDAPALAVAASPAPEPRAPVPAIKSAKKSGPSGIELRRSQSADLAPKDFDDEDARAPSGGAATEREAKAAVGAATDKSKLAVRAAGAGAGAPPPPAQPAATSAEVSGRLTATSDRASATPPKPSKLAPPPPSGAFAKSAAPAETESAEPRDGDTAVFAWAQKQHDRVVALVKSSNCPAAASAATEIYSRAPAYYAANVANDRAVKPCLSYITSDREREDRRLAAKRAMSNDAAESAAPAAPPAAKPAAPARP